MDKTTLSAELCAFLAQAPENLIGEADALQPQQLGARIFDEPLLGVAAADDPLFAAFRDEPQAGCASMLLPCEWLPSARSVLVCFLPWNPAVRRYDRVAEQPRGVHIFGPEGYPIIDALKRFLIERLAAAGYQALDPESDPRFFWHGKQMRRDPERRVGSNFSLRHAAYIAGLGTFSLSRGLITERGMAGRLIGVVTDAPLAADVRPYTELTEYCNGCGACIRRCPAGAIDEAGKDHLTCADWLDAIRDVYHAVVNCSCCQIEVPCEYERPTK